MDGYLDQQVPYTLANVRMDELLCFFNAFPSSSSSFRVTRLLGFIALRLASARVLAWSDGDKKKQNCFSARLKLPNNLREVNRVRRTACNNVCRRVPSVGDFDRTARHRAPNGHFSRAQTARLFLHNLLFLMSTELQQAVSLTPQPAVQSAVLVLLVSVASLSFSSLPLAALTLMWWKYSSLFISFFCRSHKEMGP